LEFLKHQNLEIDLCKVWFEQPMEKALSENKLGKLCFLHFLGGHWSTQNQENVSIINSLLLKLIFKEISFEDSGIFVKWCIRKAADEYGQTLVHQVLPTPFKAAASAFNLLGTATDSKISLAGLAYQVLNKCMMLHAVEYIGF